MFQDQIQFNPLDKKTGERRLIFISRRTKSQIQSLQLPLLNQKNSKMIL
jgi:hypothetical protein